MSVETAFEIINPDGKFPLVVTCEHASCCVPAAYNTLGISKQELCRHIGWDIGARAVTETVARLLDAPAVCSGYSRLLIDCNRDVSDHDLIVQKSDGTPIPGNLNLSEAERHKRLTLFYQPYHDAIDDAIDGLIDRLLGDQAISQTGPQAVRLLSLHSFTPSMNGQDRPFDIGILFDHKYDEVAEAFGQRLHEAGYRVRNNEPYSGYDGLIFSARSHGERHQLVYLELEMNNSLLVQPEEIERMGTTISHVCRVLFGQKEN